MTSLRYTSIDPVSDVVSGTTDTPWTVDFWVCSESDCVNRNEPVLNGVVSANFAIPGNEDFEQGTYDIQPGTNGDSAQWDEDGDGTMVGWNAPTNQPPIADAGGPYFGREGSPVTLNANGSTDPEDNIASYAWDLDGDGQFDDAIGRRPRYTFADNGIYIISVLVTDIYGLQDTDESTVAIQNVPPVITSITIPSIIRAGSSANFRARFRDEGVNDTFTATWKWGDGTSSTGTVSGTIVTGSHTYQRFGIYLVTIRVKDKDGAVAERHVLIVVLPRR